MNNETQPTPEQLAKWREEFISTTIESMWQGYIHAKQENEQALKDARKQALEDTLDLFPQGFAMLSTNQVREIIRGLLK